LVGPRELNRWTLARQLLLERAELDAVTAIERLAGMQAQHPPSPYIGLWSRLRGLRREELEAAVMDGRVFKATLMRGTLHLISEREFDRYRVACRHRNALLARALRQMAEAGADAELLREEILALLRERPQSRAELLGALAHRVPDGMSQWLAFAVLHLTGATMNVPEDARFDHHAGSRYRLAPPPLADPDTALRCVLTAYLRAFGPASRADIAQWLGQPIGIFGPALAQLDVVTFQAEDGRSLVDLADAPRPDPDVPAPVRFLPKWDNLLLAYQRRERVLPEQLRRTVIGKNGDVLATFLVDGMVAGAWEAPRRGRATMTLTAFGRLPARSRREVAREGEALLGWLRPDAASREVRWAPD
jgi:Winged helix DNA-binding domain